jgi:hypothetical protein
MVTAAAGSTGKVVTANDAEVALAETTTLVGTVAAGVFELESVTVPPPGPAMPFRVTVPVAPVPPVTLDGLTVTDEIAAGLIVSVAVFVVPE